MREVFDRIEEFKKLMVGYGLSGKFTVELDPNDFDIFLAKSDRQVRAVLKESGHRADDVRWFESRGIVFLRRPLNCTN